MGLCRQAASVGKPVIRQITYCPYKQRADQISELSEQGPERAVHRRTAGSFKNGPNPQATTNSSTVGKAVLQTDREKAPIRLPARG